MADKQISDLTSASGLTDGSLFVIEQGGSAMKANWGMMKNYISPSVANQYSASSTYDVGDYAIYNGTLYRCTTAITTAESWTASHWTAAVIGDDFANLKTEYSMTKAIAGVRWFNGYYQSSDNAYVSSTYYKMSNAIPCEGGDKFIYHGNSSQTNRWVVIYYNKNNTFLSGANSLGTDYTDIEVTVPAGAEYMRVLAYTDRLSDTYVIYGTNAYQNAPIENRIRILSLEAKSKQQEIKNGIAFVDGSQGTNGTGTESSPFNSINSAVDAGFRTLKVKAGVYEVNQVRVTKDPFSIELWSNASDYNTSKPNREKIILFKGDVLTPTISGGVATASYTPRTGRSFQQVFVDRTLTPIDSSFTLATAYNVNVFMWSNGHTARRYEPVLPENYTGAAGTFTYQNGTITLSPFDTDTASGLSIYVSDDASIPMYFIENQSLAISDVAIVGAYYCGLRLYGCQDVQLKDCEFVCTGHGDGLEAFDSNVSLQNCKASGCAQDGYGYQYYGESLMMNCDSFYNGDDGVSHHKGCRGYISGGEYSYNGSGGITPSFGAEVDVANATTIGNLVGLQYFGASGYPKRTVKAFCCLSKNNTDKDIYNSGYDITFIKCVYDTEQVTTGNTNTFYN
jgi:hypothetical protein